ncbi:MAG TPA: sortase [Jiangellaceae bacterium]
MDFDPSVAGWWKAAPGRGSLDRLSSWARGLEERTGRFYRLHTLQRGDEILVDRADGTTARFVVTRQGKYSKAAFPSDRVYYPTLDPELRLVTCGGLIGGSYTENLVVFAAQAS